MVYELLIVKTFFLFSFSTKTKVDLSVGVPRGQARDCQHDGHN